MTGSLCRDTCGRGRMAGLASSLRPDRLFHRLRGTYEWHRAVKTVVVDFDALHANPVHRALRLIKLLRDEGIPAFGAIALEGVESGVLSITAADLATGKVTYSWAES